MKSWEIFGAQVNLTELGLKNSPTKLLPANTILLVVRSGVLKHTIPVAISRVPATINQDMKALKCHLDVSPDYLARFIKSQSAEILQWVRATTADNFPIDNLKRLSVPLPPPEEQRRIAAILDKVEELRAKRRAALTLLDTLPAAIFRQMFGDPTENERGFEIRGVDELLDTRRGTRCGPFGSALKRHEYVDEGIPVWGIDNVESMSFTEKNALYITPQKYEGLTSYRVLDGDILISRAGTVGRMCVAHPSVERSIIGTNLIRISPNPKLLDSDFFVALLTFYGPQLGQLRVNANEEAYSFMKTGVLKTLKIPLPPIAEQKIFSDFLRSLAERKAEQLRSLCRQHDLFASIQSEAFGL